MDVIRYSQLEPFYASVSPYLLGDEASHNLTFGILGTIRHDPTRYETPYFAAVEDDGETQLAALRTPPHRLILSLAASPQAAETLAQSLFASGETLPGVTGPAEVSRQFAQAWARLTGVSTYLSRPMRTYKLSRVKPVSGVSGSLRRGTLTDRALLVEWEMAFRREAFPEDQHLIEDCERAVDARLRSTVAGFFLWEDGVTTCVTGYGGPTPNGIRIGPVYTPPEYRKRGYASACVAGASQQLLDTGKTFCFLFTDLGNPTANHIYQEIGYQPVCDFAEYVFAAPDA